MKRLRQFCAIGHGLFYGRTDWAFYFTCRRAEMQDDPVLCDPKQRRLDHLTMKHHIAIQALKLNHTSCVGWQPGCQASGIANSNGKTGAGERDRTVVCSLGSCRSTIKLRPHQLLITAWRDDLPAETMTSQYSRGIIWRKRRDSNPRSCESTTRSLSRGVPSTSRPLFHILPHLFNPANIIYWRRGRDSNPRDPCGSHAFQACRISHSRTPPKTGVGDRNRTDESRICSPEPCHSATPTKHSSFSFWRKR